MFNWTVLNLQQEKARLPVAQPMLSASQMYRREVHPVDTEGPLHPEVWFRRVVGVEANAGRAITLRIIRLGSSLIIDRIYVVGVRGRACRRLLERVEVI